MTAEAIIHLMFTVCGIIAISAFLIAGAVVATYYAWRMAESLIRKRTRYIKRIKKHVSFDVFNDKNEKRELKVVPKKNGNKAAAK